MELMRSVPGRPARAAAHRGAALAGLLLAGLAAGEAAGQPGGLFRPAAAAAAPPARGASDALTLRSRLVSIDFGQLAPPGARGAAAVSAPSGVLRLNLFADASFTGLVERVEETFSGG